MTARGEREGLGVGLGAIPYISRSADTDILISALSLGRDK